VSEGTRATILFDEIAALFDAQGHEAYGEGVSIAEHSLQTAALARAESADPALVAAALLHDIGHFIEQPDDAFGYHKHDQSGGAWLAARFPSVVSQPVRLHVAAKRYLCALEEVYFDRLSPDSVRSLALQGGAMSEQEVAAFDRLPRAAAAVQLRRFDEAAKVKDLVTPPVAHFLPYMRQCVRG